MQRPVGLKSVRCELCRTQDVPTTLCDADGTGVASNQVDSPMPPRKSSVPGSDLKTRNLNVAYPFWPLDELRDLGDPPFVADPEFTRFDLNALGGNDYRCASLSSSQATRFHLPERGNPFMALFPIPPLVAGLPWRFAKDIQCPVLPDPDFAPFDLCFIERASVRTD
jgi:hypothetical protein